MPSASFSVTNGRSFAFQSQYRKAATSSSEQISDRVSSAAAARPASEPSPCLQPRRAFSACTTYTANRMGGQRQSRGLAGQRQSGEHACRQQTPPSPALQIPATRQHGQRQEGGQEHVGRDKVAVRQQIRVEREQEERQQRRPVSESLPRPQCQH